MGKTEEEKGKKQVCDFSPSPYFSLSMSKAPASHGLMVTWGKEKVGRGYQGHVNYQAFPMFCYYGKVEPVSQRKLSKRITGMYY